MAMDKNKIYEVLNEIFCEIFDDPDLTTTPEMSAEDIPDWDSFNHINIIVASEIRFGVKFKTAELDQLENVGDFVSLLREKLSVGATAP
jgi:acyl carrier protein